MKQVSLTPEQEAGIERAVAACKSTGKHETVYGNGWDAYAYPSAGDRISFGVNGGPNGFCIARGVVAK